MGAPTQTPLGPRERLVRRLSVVLAVLVVLALGTYFLRGVVVTALVESALADRGVRCPRLGVDVSWDLSSVAVAQTTCRMGQGVREVEAGLPHGATITLEGWRARTVVVPEITLSVPGAADREIEDIGAALLDGDVPEPLERALDGLAAVARQPDLPRIEVAALRLRRGADSLSAYELLITPGDERLTFGLASVAPPAVGERRFEVAAAIAGLEGEATSGTAEIRGRIELSLELGPLDVTRGVAFRISGEGLGTPEARYTLWMEEAERLRELRTRLAGLRARRQERLEHRHERVDGVVDRVRSLAESLRERAAARAAVDAGPP